MVPNFPTAILREPPEITAACPGHIPVEAVPLLSIPASLLCPPATVEAYDQALLVVPPETVAYPCFVRFDCPPLIVDQVPEWMLGRFSILLDCPPPIVVYPLFSLMILSIPPPIAD